VSGNPSIVAVLVLYRQSLAESPTYQGLESAFAADPSLRSAIHLIVADNSALAQSLPTGFAAEYLHDGSNGGLAPRYNHALAAAKACGAAWLMLLDQDTKLTVEYVREAVRLASELREATGIVAAVPRLEIGGRTYSPHAPRLCNTRFCMTPELYGPLPEPAWAYNSGALMRVAAVAATGGFPSAYWLDFLDYATFSQMQASGGRLFLMHATLQHDLSENRPETPETRGRMEHRLLAEHRFYRDYGTACDRLLHRFDLLRQVIGHGRRGRFAASWQRLRFLLRAGRL
jgi:GT2 family glycosyltransferase